MIITIIRTGKGRREGVETLCVVCVAEGDDDVIMRVMKCNIDDGLPIATGLRFSKRGKLLGNILTIIQQNCSVIAAVLVK